MNAVYQISVAHNGFDPNTVQNTSFQRFKIEITCHAPRTRVKTVSTHSYEAEEFSDLACRDTN